ncbi:hypothetical protein ACFXPX_32765 [Kitasatospora sp. NPDC059146]|uniref:hypothetical protein n=1 Tax=unclassified Kitasatospora TaxID=2633591 RepID=UPI0036CB2D81
MVADERNRWVSFAWRRDLFVPVSVSQSLVVGTGVVLLAALSSTVAFALSEWHAEALPGKGAFGLVLRVSDLYPILPALFALVLAAFAVYLSVAAVFGADDPHLGGRRRCTCRRCRWGHWSALELRRPLFNTESMLGLAVTALTAALAADAASIAGLGLGLGVVADGHLLFPVRVVAGILAFLLLLAGIIATWGIILWSFLAVGGVFHVRNSRVRGRDNRNSAVFAPLAVYDPEGDTVSDLKNRQEQVFQQFMDAHLLPKWITGQGETTQTLRLLGVEVQEAATADMWGLVPATWPEGWRLVRKEDGYFWFDLVNGSGTAMIEGLVNGKAYDARAHLRLTDAGRREARCRWYGLSDSERALMQQRGGPWKPPYPAVAEGPHFEAGDNYALVAAQLRARGWTIGAEEATGVQVVLSEAASAWAAERRAGDSFWLLPGGTSANTARTGCSGDGTYPWDTQEAKASWQDPRALADEVDRVLRDGYPGEPASENAAADML